MGKKRGCRCGCRSRCDRCDCCRCGCRCRDGGFKRRYRTNEEQTAELEEYLKELKAEVQAVEERLKDFKQKK